MTEVNKQNISIAVIVVLYAVGVFGLLSPWRHLFQMATPITLFISACLLIWNHVNKNWKLVWFGGAAFVVGFGSEYLGVNYQLIFGNYQYGATLGIKFWNVPLMIGVNWFITIYSIGSVLPSRLPLSLFVLIAAGMAVALDWLMEPVAIAYDFWSWQNGEVPFSNYVGWFGVSVFLFLVFKRADLGGRNKFAIWFLIVESLFFVVLNAASRF
ncbi:MAG: carotenoid biosynthesis protein [Bacteroidetes bacterium]|nr:carotenoid biosynthesis protein [Bacteroidota bacterium]